MRTLCITMKVDLPDPEEVEAQVENIAHAIYAGMICRPLEKKCEMVIAEPELRARLGNALDLAGVELYIQALRDTQAHEQAFLKALWESREITIDPPV